MVIVTNVYDLGLSPPWVADGRLKCFFMVKKSKKRSFWSSERREGLLVEEEAEKRSEDILFGQLQHEPPGN